MQTKFLKTITAALAFIIVLASISLSCQKDVSANQQLQVTNSAQEDLVARADSAHAPYNLDVILYGAGNNGGFVKFRQNPDTAHIIKLDTWVGNLKPDHTYLLQRAVNVITDTTQCSSTTWLTLGKGLVPQSITTDVNGNGNEDLWRDVSSAGAGTQFYIHFQVVDSLTLKVALTSGCYQYTVR